MSDITEIRLKSSTYRNNVNIISVDTNYVKFVNNDASNAFGNCANLITITNLNENITNMYSTFYNCPSLSDVSEIPNNVNNLNASFYGCINLQNAPVISNNVTDMWQTFYYCNNLVNVSEIPNSVTNMISTFYSCHNLRNTPDMSNTTNVTNMRLTFGACYNLRNVISLPNNVIDMNQTFYYCNNLINVPAIPNNVTNMYGTFYSCWKLQNSPEIPSTITNMDSTFYQCYNLINASVIPNSVTSLISTFQTCTDLQDAPAIPDSVTNMYSTFSDCVNLINVPIIGNNVMNMDSTFYGCRNLQNISAIPSSVNELKFTFQDCRNLVNAPVIPNSVTKMHYTFGSCYNLQNIIEIPDSVTFMNCTFNWCNNLEIAPTIGNGVTDMGVVFGNCTNLTGDIYISSENISNIDGCFYRSTLNKDVYIPFQNNGVNTITYNTFNNSHYSISSRNSSDGVLLKDLQELIDLNDWRYITNGNIRELQEYLGSDDDINVPGYRTKISTIDTTNCPFYNNQTFNSVNLHYIPFENNSMTMAFYNCINLKEVTKINKRITEMCNTFHSCSNLVNSPIIPNSVTNMESTFAYCYNLTNAPTIPNTVTNMWYSFIDCYVIENSPIITESVTDMSSTFQSCINLSGDVYITSENITNANYCFYNTYSTKNVYIPFTYENNVNTLTYDSFINAGYSTSSRVNGALLMDIATKSYIIFNVTPSENTIKYLNGRQVDYDKSIANSDNEYVLYNENYPVIVGHVNNLTSQEEYTVTKNLASFGYSITLITGQQNCNVTFDINGVKLPSIDHGSMYSITLNTDEQITVGYTVEKIGYRSVVGSVLFNNSEISQNITMTQDIWTTWVRPNLTADGTMGGSSFAVEASCIESKYAYYAVDSDSSTYWSAKLTSDVIYTLYNPKKLKISQMITSYTGASYAPSNINIEVSNDRLSWISIYDSSSSGTTSDTMNLVLDEGYNYYRLKLRTRSLAISGIKISDIAITAQELQN